MFYLYFYSCWCTVIQINHNICFVTGLKDGPSCALEEEEEEAIHEDGDDEDVAEEER